MLAIMADVPLTKPNLVFFLVLVLALVLLYAILVLSMAVKRFGWKNAWKNKSLESVAKKQGCFVHAFASIALVLLFWSFLGFSEPFVLFMVFLIAADLIFDISLRLLTAKRCGWKEFFEADSFSHTLDSRKAPRHLVFYWIVLLLGTIVFLFFQVKAK